MSTQSKAPTGPNARRIQQIRSLWLKTETSNGVVRGSLAAYELESYFRASVILMNWRLKAMSTASKRVDPSIRKTLSRHIRQFKKELKVSAQIGYLLLRSSRIE